MLEQLTRYFTAAHRLRRSERKLVRGGALMELQELQAEVNHPRLKGRIAATINSHVSAKAKAS